MHRGRGALRAPGNGKANAAPAALALIALVSEHQPCRLSPNRSGLIAVCRCAGQSKGRGLVCQQQNTSQQIYFPRCGESHIRPYPPLLYPGRIVCTGEAHEATGFHWSARRRGSLAPPPCVRARFVDPSPSWISARARSHSRLGPEGHMGHLITNALARPFSISSLRLADLGGKANYGI